MALAESVVSESAVKTEIPQIEVVKEIRFAVVMYGGVSLAIYINGVAQELLRMTRATAIAATADGGTKFKFADDDLDDAEKVYRDLSYLLADDSPAQIERIKRYTEWLRKQRESAADPLDKIKLDEANNPLNEIKQSNSAKVVRFVVDILSGSSAGGINGVYLAKALIDGQRISTLEKLWKTEGDFAKLLCDEQSLFDDENQTERIGLVLQNPPPSLLNSQRMYLKLLRAFEQMNENEPLTGKSGEAAFVDEVDLFVTMTDFWGIPVPIRLFDQLIHERRHRQNLHFKFRKYDNQNADRFLNDFKPEFYPFLAYSARCTSSFPIAFDPMQLKTAETVINQVQNAHSEGSIKTGFKNPAVNYDVWKRSFSPAMIQDQAGNSLEINWKERVFVDGGYLDNKPFGYAIKALEQKQSSVLVDRKLIYVEPEPDLDDGLERAARTAPPLALENAMAALTDMPRYETIREDLQEVLQRNRLIVRVNQLVANARRDETASLLLSLNRLNPITQQYRNLLNDLPQEKRSENGAGSPVWQTLTLGELAQQKGQAIYPYYRLRISALNDDLARMITRRAGLDENSDYFFAVRDLVRVWRKKNFSAGETDDLTRNDNGANNENAARADIENAPAAQPNSPLKFLSDYDYNYRLRRLRFVMQQADQLLLFDDDLKNELRRVAQVSNSPELLDKIGALDPAQRKALPDLFPFVEAEIFGERRLAPEAANRRPVPSERILTAIENPTEREPLNRFVRQIKADLNRVLQQLRRRLWEIDPNSTALEPHSNALRQNLELNIRETIEKVGIDGLERLLGKTGNNGASSLSNNYDVEARGQQAENIIKEKGIAGNLQKIGERLFDIYNAAPKSNEPPESIFGVSKAKIKEIFAAGEDSLENAVRLYLLHFYENFDAYDQIIFPVTYETPIGEAAIVDVARISPLDAPSLIDETLEKKIAAEIARRSAGSISASIESPDVSAKVKAEIADRKLQTGYRARTKVAGGVFRAFGAFFAENWRENDILWGRLDAMERLMSIVLICNQPPAAETFADLRQNATETLHEIALRESDLMRDDYKKYRRQPNAEIFASLAEYVRRKYTVKRNLQESDVIKTTARSLAVLQKVFREDELGGLNFVKDVGLKGAGLMIGTKVEPAKASKSPVFYLLAIPFLLIVAPAVILCAALIVPLGIQTWQALIIGVVLILLLYAAVWYFVNRFYKSFVNEFFKPRQFAVDIIMKMVGGKNTA